MVTCCAIGCVNRSDRRYCQGVTFHKFPSEPMRRELWIKAVQRGEWQPAHRSVLCSAHFNEEDFDRSSTSSVRLRPGVVPSKFPDPNIKSRKSIARSACRQYDGFFSLSARLCQLSAALQKKDETLTKEETKLTTEVNTHEVIESTAHQIVQENAPRTLPAALPEIPNQVIGIKRKQPDVVPVKFSEANSPLTIIKPPDYHQPSPPHISEGLMPHRFLEIQLNENEKHERIKPDILSQVMSCNENLAVTVSTIPSQMDSTITAIKIPRTSQKDIFKNISVKKSFAPLPHRFLEVELKVLEEQPEVKIFLSDEISIRKVSGESSLRPGLTIIPRNTRDNVFSPFCSANRLNQTS